MWLTEFICIKRIVDLRFRLWRTPLAECGTELRVNVGESRKNESSKCTVN